VTPILLVAEVIDVLENFVFNPESPIFNIKYRVSESLN